MAHFILNLEYIHMIDTDGAMSQDVLESYNPESFQTIQSNWYSQSHIGSGRALIKANVLKLDEEAPLVPNPP